MQIMVMVEATRQVVEVVVMVEVTDLWVRTSALSVVVLDIGLVIALQLVAAEVAAAASSPPAPGLVGLVAVEIAMQIVTVTWMIDMMQGVLVIETAMTVEIASMEAAVAMLTTGTRRVEIGLEAIGMEPQIGTHHHHHHRVVGMGGRETMIGMSAQGGAVTDTAAVEVEVEDQHVMKEEATGTEQVHMSVLEGEEAVHLPSTIEKVPCYFGCDDG